MQEFYRILDANLNRVSEGLRVVEDLARFYFELSDVTEELKNFRHSIRKSVLDLQSKLIRGRNAESDIGLKISQKTVLDNKDSLLNLVTANFKRVQEGLRVIEETLKVVGYYEKSKAFENFRYTSYAMERSYLEKTALIQKKKFPTTDLYCLISEDHSLGRSNLEVVKEMLEEGIEIIQYREKDKSKLAKYQECKAIRKLTKEYGVTFIINDDVDIALLVKADGVHIGQDDLPLKAARDLVGNQMLIGVSTHSPEQAQQAMQGGADYIGVGPIFKTYTKKDVCDPVGFAYLDYVVRNVTIPFVAIGGIKEHNVKEIINRGANCIAMVTEIVGSKDIKEKINSLRKMMKK